MINIIMVRRYFKMYGKYCSIENDPTCELIRRAYLATILGMLKFDEHDGNHILLYTGILHLPLFDN